MRALLVILGLLSFLGAAERAPRVDDVIVVAHALTAGDAAHGAGDGVVVAARGAKPVSIRVDVKELVPPPCAVDDGWAAVHAARAPLGARPPTRVTPLPAASRIAHFFVAAPARAGPATA